MHGQRHTLTTVRAKKRNKTERIGRQGEKKDKTKNTENGYLCLAWMNNDSDCIRADQNTVIPFILFNVAVVAHYICYSIGIVLSTFANKMPMAVGHH